MTGNDQILLTRTISLMHSQGHFCLQSHTCHTTNVWPGWKVVYCIKHSSFTHTLSHGHLPLAQACAQAHPPEGTLLQRAGTWPTHKGGDLWCAMRSFLTFLSFPPQALLAHPSLHTHLMAQCSMKFSMTQRLLWRWGQPVLLPTFSLTFSFWANREQGETL